MSLFSERLREARKKSGLSGEELAARIGVSKAYVSQLENDKRDNPSRTILDALCTTLQVNRGWLTGDVPSLGKTEGASVQALGKTGTKNFPAVQEPWAQYGLQVQMVKVYGFAQALGIRAHKGDLIPENVEELPTIPVPADGKTYVGFRVEGNSMAPTVRDGMIALADVKAELANKCIVVCKWDDTLTIKRYRRVGNMIYLTSDNTEAGEDYEVHAREMEWCLRIVKLHVELV
jgi:transcriptional regulator with XRE-family HTH domain